MSDNEAILEALHALEESNKAINTTLVAMLAQLVKLEDKQYGEVGGKNGITAFDRAHAGILQAKSLEK